jgi:hypothetical protein
MLNKPHKLETLPKWAQWHINNLETEIRHLQALKQMHAVLSEPDRDWFTLPNSIGGCDKETMHLWILTSDHPFPVCSLYKNDMLFVGRATK